MSVDEEYISNFTSEDISSKLSFYLVAVEDIDAVLHLMKDRNPHLNEVSLFKYVKRKFKFVVMEKSTHSLLLNMKIE